MITALAESEMKEVDKLRSEGIDVAVMPSKHSVYFENIYGENQDNRTQRVLAKADPFTVDYLKDIQAKIIHLGSMLADDLSLDVVKYMADSYPPTLKVICAKSVIRKSTLWTGQKRKKH